MLSDDTITLRQPTRDDTALLIDAIRSSHAEINPWLPFATADYSEDDANFFLDLVEKGYEQSFLIFYGGQMCGVCGINGINTEHHTGNLGYWMRTDCTGRGVATRAARLVAIYGLTELKLQRIEVLAATENTASQRVAERAGFAAEGIRRKALRAHNQQHDVVVYAATQDDYEHLRSMV